MREWKETCPSAEKKTSAKHFLKQEFLLKISLVVLRAFGFSVSGCSGNEVDCLNKKSQLIQFYKRKNSENGEKPRG